MSLVQSEAPLRSEMMDTFGTRQLRCKLILHNEFKGRSMDGQLESLARSDGIVKYTLGGVRYVFLFSWLYYNTKSTRIICLEGKGTIESITFVVIFFFVIFDFEFF